MAGVYFVSISIHLSVVTVPFRYNFTASVARVTEAIIQCFFRGNKIFITKLKQEQCLRFNESAFMGQVPINFKKKAVPVILILLKYIGFG